VNHRIKLALAAAALTVGGTGFTTPAHAAPGYSDTLIASSCIDIDWSGVQFIGGGGIFHGPAACNAPFNLLPDVCVGVSDTDNVPISLPGETGPCAIGPIWGTYTNVICTTGVATGVVEITESDGSTDTYGFTIMFAAGQGVIVISSGSDDGTEIGTGVVNIVPSRGDCVNGVTQFRFAAVVPLMLDI
jgi:hypothetical protein